MTAGRAETRAMSGSALDAVRRVHEEKFFKTEQEAEVRRYIARLKAEGRYESAMEAARRRAPTTSVGASALPQIMAHSLRLAGPDEVKVDRRVIDREFMNRHTVRPAKYTDGFLLGGRVSLGKNKWVAGTTQSGVENATIFSVHKASTLMSEGPKRANTFESRAAKHMVDTSFVEVAGKRIKLMPDPTPGRAMAWGGTLAVWGTLGLTLTACKTLGIHSLSDVTTVMKRRLQPYGDTIRDYMTPFKKLFALDSIHDPNSPQFKDSEFAHGIRRVFA